MEFQEKLGLLLKDFPHVFHKFTPDVKKAYLETSLSQAIRDKTWDTATGLLKDLLGLESQSTEVAEQSLDNLIATVLDSFDPAESNQAGDSLVQAASELSKALRALQPCLPASASKQVQAVLLVAEAGPDSNLSEVQEAYTVVSQGSELPILRAIHHCSLGKQLLQRCDDGVQKMLVEQDAVEAVTSCKRVFQETEQEPMIEKYLQGSPITSEELADFSKALGAISEASGKLVAALQVCDKRLQLEVIQAFATLLAKLTSKANGAFRGRLQAVMTSITQDMAVDVDGRNEKDEIMAHSCIWSLIGCSKGQVEMPEVGADNVVKLLDLIRAKAILEESDALLPILSTARSLEHLVPWNLEALRVEVGSCS